MRTFYFSIPLDTVSSFTISPHLLIVSWTFDDI